VGADELGQDRLLDAGEDLIGLVLGDDVGGDADGAAAVAAVDDV
jgi:hypothetical protein